MEFTWKITFIWEEEKIGRNETPKTSFVLKEVGKEYPSSIYVDLRKDKIKELAKFKLGDTITIWLNFKAREYNGRCFNSVSAWKITWADTWLDDSWDLPF